MEKKIRTPLAAILLTLIIARQIFVLIYELFFNDYGIHIYIYNFIIMGIDVFLCGVLFAKKRNIVLVIALALKTILDINVIVYLIKYCYYTSVLTYLEMALEIIAYALLALYALASCEQISIKAKLSKVKEFADKFFYLPALMMALSYLSIFYFSLGGEINWETVLSFLISLILWGLEVAVWLSLCLWLKDPYSKKETTSSTADDDLGDGYYKLSKHILLLIFTGGIWYLIWIHRTTKHLNKAPNAEYYNPTSKLLLFMFVPFYFIYWHYKHGQRIDSINKAKGLHGSDMATLFMILGILIPTIAAIIMQDKINAICTSKGTNIVSQEQPSTIEELKKYKELLDAGIITQEEFDTKKTQLLNL